MNAEQRYAQWWYSGPACRVELEPIPRGFSHIPTDLVVAQKALDVESSLRLDFLLLHNLRRRFFA